MFGRLRQHFSAWRQARKAHEEAWSGWTEPQSSGLTRFQEFARAALEREFGPIPFELLGVREPYLFAVAPRPDVQVYIYENGCDLMGAVPELRAERWDFENPESLVAEMVLRLRRASPSAI